MPLTKHQDLPLTAPSPSPEALARRSKQIEREIQLGILKANLRKAGVPERFWRYAEEKT